MPTKYIIKKEIFSNRLKELMLDNNETTYGLGELLNLSASTISRYTAAKIIPKITTVYAIANHFNVNPIWLMGYNVEKNLSSLNNNFTLSNQESELINIFNKFDIEDKNKIMDYTKLLYLQDKYKNK